MRNNMLDKEIWNIKKTDNIYLNELKKFYDIADKIENEELRYNIIKQMYKCEDKLLELIKKV